MKFLRYPGGKRKLLTFLSKYLPESDSIEGKYIEPFVGGGSIYFSMQPKRSILADLNVELIDLYRGIRRYPRNVWEIFEKFPTGKHSYYKIRDEKPHKNTLSYRAARILYLNRTCFKGMWRHNAAGTFNVGYGGEERRWVVTLDNILQVSKALISTQIIQSDFASTLQKASDSDFIFLDPPYKPGERGLKESHYVYESFSFEEQERLACTLIEISKNKNIRWMMTNSSHPDIRYLYRDFHVVNIPKGTSGRIGIHTNDPHEILIANYLL